ncbi:MAG: hypothetical protein G8345_21355, partial [Magnetococcales bacterium]|nr:hypothetical protein [Magnetococcales bacterium]
EGVGKSHVLAAAMDYHRRQGGVAACLQVSSLLPHVGEMGEGMLVRLLQEHAHCGLVTVDGLELLAASPGLQEMVLYLFNQLRAEKRLLLMASRLFPGQLQNIREDLRTRLAWGAVVALDPPSDDMLGQILHKLASDRQVNLAVGVIQYLVTRLPRRIPVYLHAISQLDHASLTQQRPITIALAKEVLEELHTERVAGESIG